MVEPEIKIIGNQINEKDKYILPYSIKVGNGYFFVIDRLTSKLYKYDLFGEGGELPLYDNGKKINLLFPYDLLIYNDLVYIADGGNYRIIVFDFDGNYRFEFGKNCYGESMFGNGGIFNGDGRSSNPQSLFIDNDNNINAVDCFEKCIKVFDSEGIYLRKYSLSGMISYGVCDVDEEGNIYVSDTQDNKIRCFNKRLELVWEIGREGSNNGEFKIPWRILIHDNLLYVGDIYNHRIQIFTKDGLYVDQFGKYGLGEDGFNYIFGFDFDKKGKLYLTDTWNHRLKIYNRGLVLDKVIGSYQENIVLRPAAIIFSKDEKLFYVADYLNHSIAIFESNGEFIKRIGRLGTKNGEFNYPNDIFIDSNELLYISDSKNKRVQILTSEGEYLNQIPKNGEVEIIPSSVAVYGDRIFVADISNSKIHEFDKKTLSYKGIIADRGDAIGEVKSDYKTSFIRLNIWKDNLILADSSNNRVQKYDLIENQFDEVLSIHNNNIVRAKIVRDDFMLVVNRGNHKVEIVDINTHRIIKTIGNNLGNDINSMIAPWDADYSISNNLLVILDSLNNRIKLIKNVL
ncbi:NHL repeat-containing protein [Tissierella sp.]|uniref:NHL repeat-containing protein n=1 Tax=Tissierella sp. TaxID=41274 RepID=UPI00285D02C2|nr:NHL repeat-containing protein [Tissierella sp.]MDR7857548.1 NHL repeat-containing protein [Tissierella sp.]